MAKYRKKPLKVEAVQITKEWFSGGHPNPLHLVDRRIKIFPIERRVEINTLEGVMVAWEGDWIITTIKGEVYPCKPYIFEATYEKVI